jgi:hypothetical protein
MSLLKELVSMENEDSDPNKGHCSVVKPVVRRR